MTLIYLTNYIVSVNTTNKFKLIDQLTCPDCEMKYTGQTGRPFKVRYQEHLRDFKYNNSKSGFAHTS